MKVIFFFFSFLLSIQVNAQNIASINEIHILEYSNKGFRVGHILKHFKFLEQTKPVILKMDRNEVDSLYGIISRAQIKRIVEGKTGSNQLFSKITTSQYEVLLVTISDFCISDYSNNRNYWIKDVESRAYIKRLIEKYSVTPRSR
jgi:hypothetical protein